jgi:predicted MFS family arabinose efflux permease
LPFIGELSIANLEVSQHSDEVSVEDWDCTMFSRRLKTGYFVLEGLNSFATVYFFYYLYFFMQKAYGFGNKANLVLAALNGATYALTAWFGGKFAQRYGYFTALKLGYAIMALALTLGLGARTSTGVVWAMVLTVVGMSFTWPTLEALVSEGEPRAGLQHMVGVYNVVWAATAALANFSGGAMLQKLGLASLFYIPIAIHLSQLGLTFWLESKADTRMEKGSAVGRASEAGRMVALQAAPVTLTFEAESAQETRRERHSLVNGQSSPPDFIQGQVEPIIPEVRDVSADRQGVTDVASEGHRVSEDHFAIPKARRFLRMAWLANPFAYIAINTLIAVVPGVARRLELSTMAAGFCCSTWCFSRFGTFALLWRWTGWHYRFRWLLLSYLGLVASFAGTVLAPNITVLVISQLIFGGAVGLLYYSSLFYSMDRSETKGEHGGIHEAAIGLGNCAGPAVGAATLQLLPQHSQSGTAAVIILLLCGLCGLIGIWKAKTN